MAFCRQKCAPEKNFLEDYLHGRYLQGKHKAHEDYDYYIWGNNLLKNLNCKANHKLTVLLKWHTEVREVTKVSGYIQVFSLKA